jgi:hypothetical protein
MTDATKGELTWQPQALINWCMNLKISTGELRSPCCLKDLVHNGVRCRSCLDRKRQDCAISEATAYNNAKK